MRNIFAVATAVALAGCSFNVTLMPRDSGVSYSGVLQGSGGSGSMTVDLGGKSCTGPAARVASNETFGFTSAYGYGGRGQSGAAFATTATAGDVQVKALLSCAGGHGMRCDITGNGATGGGICVDDSGKVYDVLVVRK